MKWIKSFKNISKEDTTIAGGKGASLGEMTQAVIPVPDGYVITSETFDKFLEITDLNIEIDALLNDVDTEAIHTAEKASEEIQRLILAHDIPEDMKKEILSSFKELNIEFVAVRSSATAEDSATAAWAGQLDSFLNTTEETLLENVRRCWASLFTPRAIFYRFEQKLDKEAISVAVVVQKMVNSEVSGIAFSVHPVTEDRNQIIIEAGLGLGEAIVSGSITPDSYVVTKKPREILDKNVITQDRGMFRKEGGGNEWKDIEREEGGKQVLSDEQIQELTEIIINIENHYNFPVDIEWAVEGGKFYIVQSRPITTLSDEQIIVEKEQLELYKQEAKIGFYQVFLPFLTITARMQKYFKNSYGKVWLHSYKGNFTSLLIKDNMKVVSREVFEKAADGSFYEIWNKWKNIEEELLNLSKKIKDLDLEKLSNQELWEQYKVVYEKDLEMWDISIFIDALDIGLDQEEIDRIALENHFSPDEVHTLLTPVVSSYITIVENDLVYVRDGKMKVSEFSDKYFWYGTDYSVCREVTEEYVNKLAQDAQFTELEDVVVKQEKILDKYELNENPLRLFQVLAQWRDDRKRINYIGLYGCCSLISEGMKRQGIKTSLLNNLFVSEVGDVFLGEITSEKLEKRFNTPILSEIKEDGSWSFVEGDEATQEFERLSTFLPSTNVAEISGTTASPGVVRGIVRVVSHFSSESSKLMREGDILVTSMTRPEFVPLMRIAGGIVTNEGGISCHAAIVSRELKKPCIIGTKIATQVLKDGDMVEVDADNGVIRILERDNFSIKDFVLGFEVKKQPVLFQEFLCKYYFPSGAIYTAQNGILKSYVSNPTLKEITEKGRVYFSHLESIQTISTELENTFGRMKSLQSVWNSGTDITEEVMKEILDKSVRVHQLYSHFYTAFTDGAFLLDDSNLEKEKVLSFLDKWKNEFRETYNDLFFNKLGLYDSFFIQLANQFKLDVEDLKLYRQDELGELFKGKLVPSDEITLRSQAYVFTRFNDSIDFLQGSNAEQFIEKFGDIDLSQLKQISGTTANKGKVQGRVKIVNSDYTDFDLTRRDMKEMHKGDILVSITTAPELMEACNKASAIITDLGGLLSHAAIVSRELGIPCIVGTQYATKILKDGDMVEVDADNGVVRIL